jgi:hypothetical protein
MKWRGNNRVKSRSQWYNNSLKPHYFNSSHPNEWLHPSRHDHVHCGSQTWAARHTEALLSDPSPMQHCYGFYWHRVKFRIFPIFCILPLGNIIDSDLIYSASQVLPREILIDSFCLCLLYDHMDQSLGYKSLPVLLLPCLSLLHKHSK